MAMGAKMAGRHGAERGEEEGAGAGEPLPSRLPPSPSHLNRHARLLASLPSRAASLCVSKSVFPARPSWCVVRWRRWGTAVCCCEAAPLPRDGRTDRCLPRPHWGRPLPSPSPSLSSPLPHSLVRPALCLPFLPSFLPLVWPDLRRRRRLLRACGRSACRCLFFDSRSDNRRPEQREQHGIV
jgi:hypothetical protein